MLEELFKFPVKAIASTSVSGYKSILSKQKIVIKPLTILAGANSSGKSSAMQPLLILKQTLEPNYDPGILRLNGDNVRLSNIDQILSRKGKRRQVDAFSVEVDIDAIKIEIVFSKDRLGKPKTNKCRYFLVDGRLEISENMKSEDISRSLSAFLKETKLDQAGFPTQSLAKSEWKIKSDRSFLFPEVVRRNEEPISIEAIMLSEILNSLLKSSAAKKIQEIIHVPGLRGNPERSYQTSAVNPPYFPGTFERYVASIIHSWKGTPKIQELNKVFSACGLTWGVTSRSIDQAQVELKVGRAPKAGRGGAYDMVNISDVGFGISQILAVLVSLIVAEENQIVYIEQPEIHLHPRAQVALAEILAATAERGVKVVIETHSSLLLTGIQTAVAKGKINKDSVILYWFNRDGRTGFTSITEGKMDDSGAYGDWPADFDDVSLSASAAYIEEAEKHLFE